MINRIHDKTQGQRDKDEMIHVLRQIASGKVRRILQSVAYYGSLFLDCNLVSDFHMTGLLNFSCHDLEVSKVSLFLPEGKKCLNLNAANVLI